MAAYVLVVSVCVRRASERGGGDGDVFLFVSLRDSVEQVLTTKSTLWKKGQIKKESIKRDNTASLSPQAELS